jgi:hypothetical protein
MVFELRARASCGGGGRRIDRAVAAAVQASTDTTLMSNMGVRANFMVSPQS